MNIIQRSGEDAFAQLINFNHENDLTYFLRSLTNERYN